MDEELRVRAARDANPLAREVLGAGDEAIGPREEARAAVGRVERREDLESPWSGRSTIGVTYAVATSTSPAARAASASRPTPNPRCSTTRPCAAKYPFACAMKTRPKAGMWDVPRVSRSRSPPAVQAAASINAAAVTRLRVSDIRASSGLDGGTLSPSRGPERRPCWVEGRPVRPAAAMRDARWATGVGRRAGRGDEAHRPSAARRPARGPAAARARAAPRGRAGPAADARGGRAGAALARPAPAALAAESRSRTPARGCAGSRFRPCGPPRCGRRSCCFCGAGALAARGALPSRRPGRRLRHAIRSPERDRALALGPREACSRPVAPASGAPAGARRRARSGRRAARRAARRRPRRTPGSARGGGSSVTTANTRRSRAHRNSRRDRPAVDLDAGDRLVPEPLREDQVDGREQPRERRAARQRAARRTPSPRGPSIAAATAPARRSTSVSLPATSNGWAWRVCFRTATRDARRASAGMSRARRRVLPEPLGPETATIGGRARGQASRPPRRRGRGRRARRRRGATPSPPAPAARSPAPEGTRSERVRERRAADLGRVPSERPDGAAWLEPRPEEPGAPGRALDRLREPQRHDRRSRPRAPASARSAGRAKTSNATRHADGLPGSPSTGFPPASAKRNGLPGFIGTPCTRTSAPSARERRRDVVPLADRDAADRDDRVGARRAPRRARPARPRADRGHGRAGARRPAPRRAPRARRRSSPASARHDLVAGGDDRDARRAGGPATGRRRRPRAAPPGAPRSATPAASASPPRATSSPARLTFSPGRAAAEEADAGALRPRRLLAHHRVRAVGERRAGEDPRRLAGASGRGRDVARVDRLPRPAACTGPATSAARTAYPSIAEQVWGGASDARERVGGEVAADARPRAAPPRPRPARDRAQTCRPGWRAAGPSGRASCHRIRRVGALRKLLRRLPS